MNALVQTALLKKASEWAVSPERLAVIQQDKAITGEALLALLTEYRREGCIASCHQQVDPARPNSPFIFGLVGSRLVEGHSQGLQANGGSRRAPQNTAPSAKLGLSSGPTGPTQV